MRRGVALPGAPGSGLWYPGLGVESALTLFPDIQPLTFDFELSIPVTFTAQNRPSTIEYYCLVVNIEREWAMFARGAASLHIAHVPVPKSLAAKSRISTSSKLIDTNRLQVLYFGHLRKTGGRGGYRLVHTGRISDIGNEWRGESQMDAESKACVAPPQLGIYWVGKPTAYAVG
jgi:hypothetical protein